MVTAERRKQRDGKTTGARESNRSSAGKSSFDESVDGLLPSREITPELCLQRLPDSLLGDGIQIRAVQDPTNGDLEFLILDVSDAQRCCRRERRKEVRVGSRWRRLSEWGSSHHVVVLVVGRGSFVAVLLISSSSFHSSSSVERVGSVLALPTWRVISVVPLLVVGVSTSFVSVGVETGR